MSDANFQPENLASAVESQVRLLEGLVLRGIAAGRNPDGVDDASDVALMVIDEYQFICRRLLVAYQEEEQQDGFPFSFKLRQAHADLKRLLEAGHG